MPIPPILDQSKSPFYSLVQVLTVLVLWVSPAYGAGGKILPQCQSALTSDLTRTVNWLRRKGFIVEFTPDRVSIEHKSRYAHAWARMLEKDLMMLGLYTRGSNPRDRIKGFDGHMLFKFFLDYFGPQVKSILGNWDGDSVNLVQFNEWSRRLSHSEAAFNTWTGKQAARHGFTDVEVLEVKGDPGAYTEVVVEFKKPH